MEHSKTTPRLFIRTTSIAPGKLTDLLETVNAVAPFHALMADYWNSPGIFVDYKASKALAQRVEDCLTGSAFGPNAEIRWRRIGKRFRVILVAEIDELQMGDKAGVAWKAMVTKTEAQHQRATGLADIVWIEEKAEVERCKDQRDGGNCRLLWGTKYLHSSEQSSRWIEGRIPRPLDYPVPPEGGADYDHVCVHLVEYLDERGRVVTFRRTHLSAYLKNAAAGEAAREESHGEKETSNEAR